MIQIPFSYLDRTKVFLWIKGSFSPNLNSIKARTITIMAGTTLLSNKKHGNSTCKRNCGNRGNDHNKKPITVSTNPIC